MVCVRRWDLTFKAMQLRVHTVLGVFDLKAARLRLISI